MSQSFLKVSIQNKIGNVVFNRPEKRNAFSLQMWNELTKILEFLDNDENVSSIILHGNGGSFSAGADISEFKAVRGSADAASHYDSIVDNCITTLENIRKPTIASIDGCCLGGGLALALGCDFRLASSNAYFSIPAVKTGLVYNVAKCRRLISAIGAVNAKVVLLTGKRINSSDALNIGLIQSLFENDVFKEALLFASSFNDNSLISMAGMKLIVNAITLGEVEHRENEINLAIRAADESDFHKRAVSAFSS
jgi:enoyl-CoA hydratase/carnithine racemase